MMIIIVTAVGECHIIRVGECLGDILITAIIVRCIDRIGDTVHGTIGTLTAVSGADTITDIGMVIMTDIMLTAVTTADITAVTITIIPEEITDTEQGQPAEPAQM